MTSKLIVNSLAADAGVSTITFADQAKMGNAIFHSTGFTIGDSFLHSTGVNITNINATGVITATKFVGEVSVGSSITFEDNEKAYFGTGTDFSIYHNGSASYLDETGTGGLIVKTDTAFQVFNSAGSQAAFTVTPGGVVEIYHGSTKRIETDSLGINVLGRLDVSGTGANDHLNVDSNTTRLRIGGYADMQLYHDSTNINYIENYNDIDLHIKSTYGGSPSKTQAKFIHNGAVELYHNDNLKLATTSTGIDVTGAITADDLRTDNSQTFYLTSANDFRFRHTGGSEKLRITSTGRLGIGTADPQVMHHLYSASGGLYTRFESTNSQVNFGNSNGAGIIQVTSTSQPLKILVNGSNERLRIRSDGKISAGTNINTSNTYEFSVQGSDSNGAIYGHGRNHYLSNRSNAYSSLTLKKSNADSDGIDYLQLRDSSNNLKGHITGAGNWKPIAGGGIDFSADGNSSGMTSELLDDYEEGTWTATTTESGSTTGCRYIKCGNMCLVTGAVSNLANTSSSNVEITGLPFNNLLSGQVGQNSYVGALRGYNLGTNVGNSRPPTTAVLENSKITIGTAQGSGGWDMLQYNELSNSSNAIQFNIMYQTA